MGSYGRVTPAIYSTIVIVWMIASTISCIVIAIVGPIANVNAPTQYSTTHFSAISSRNRNSRVNCRCDWSLRRSSVNPRPWQMLASLNSFKFNYRPQTKFAKVMFSKVSICPHGGGVSATHPLGRHPLPRPVHAGIPPCPMHAGIHPPPPPPWVLRDPFLFND